MGGRTMNFLRTKATQRRVRQTHGVRANRFTAAANVGEELVGF